MILQELFWEKTARGERPVIFSTAYGAIRGPVLGIVCRGDGRVNALREKHPEFPLSRFQIVWDFTED